MPRKPAGWRDGVPQALPALFRQTTLGGFERHAKTGMDGEHRAANPYHSRFSAQSVSTVCAGVGQAQRAVVGRQPCDRAGAAPHKPASSCRAV